MQGGQKTFFDRLSESFGALYGCLERPAIARRTVFVLLLVHTALLAYSAYVHSPTLNEPGHLVAGLSHWKFGRFEVYRVNPPLVKMIAALPVMAVGYKEDWSGFYEGPGARPEMAMGEDFVAANSERSFFLFMIARWACIPFSWIGATVCYLWARDLYGRPAGVLACTLWCFEPNILAHASLMTPDIGGTALGVAACYTFWKWLKNPTWTQTALTGVVLGLAELCKTTLILFYPLWPLLWIVYRWPDRFSMIARDWLRESAMLTLRMAIGLYILNLGYGFEGTGTQLKEFHFVSNLFTGQQDDETEFNTSVQQLASSASSSNRFANTLLGNLPVPFPLNYVLGIDSQQKDFENYQRQSYLRGQWQEHGWWYYYLYAAVIKVPLGLWMLGLFTLFLSAFYKFSTSPFAVRQYDPTPHLCEAKRSSARNLASGFDTFLLLTPSLVIFCVVSAKTGFSEHFRYVLPCFPFFFVWVVQLGFRGVQESVWNSVDNRFKSGKIDTYGLRPLRRTSISAIFTTLLFWTLVSSLWIYPHSLSYFNESIGGPFNGPSHLLGSNVDWGQDLMYLSKYIHKHDVDAHCLVIASYDQEEIGIPGVKASSNWATVFNGGRTQFLMTSVNFIYGYSWPAYRLSRDQQLPVQSKFPKLSFRIPHTQVGYSIYVFGDR